MGPGQLHLTWGSVEVEISVGGMEVEICVGSTEVEIRVTYRSHPRQRQQWPCPATCGLPGKERGMKTRVGD